MSAFKVRLWHVHFSTLTFAAGLSTHIAATDYNLRELVNPIKRGVLNVLLISSYPGCDQLRPCGLGNLVLAQVPPRTAWS